MRISLTLFWYVFKDLLKIFFMASGALAGIMSFGGLLRPLTQNGLDGPQVAQLLEYSMPAMSTYSLPIAALFATTVVYGRMSADNEITACRASGIGFLAMTIPAALLGLLVSLGSVFLLCFTVPSAMKKMEQVFYSNMAKVIAHQIEQSHETTFDTWTIFAQSANLLPGDPRHPRDQSVVLRGPLIVSYERPNPKDRYYWQAKEFWSSSQATAIIHEEPDDPRGTTVRILLDNGVMIPRVFTGEKSNQGGMAEAEFGPMVVPSGVGEKTKFMSIYDLQKLRDDPTQGQEVQDVLTQFIREDEANAFRQKQIVDPINAGAAAVLPSGTDTFVLTAPGAKFTQVGVTTVITAGATPIQLRQESNGQTRLTASTNRCQLTVTADTVNDLAFVNVEMKDCTVDAGDNPAPSSFSRKIPVTLPAEIAAFKNRTVDQYLNSPIRDTLARAKLWFAFIDLLDHIEGEIHSRCAFMLSCFLLVFVGSSLGMMFRSGNFLSAFAVSVVPAMLSTVLIVTGQHTAEATPDLNHILNHATPLKAGIDIMWSGNVAIAAASAVMLWRLHRR